MKRCFSLLLAAGVAAAPAIAQNLTPAQRAQETVPSTATWVSQPMVSSANALGGSPNFVGQLNFVGGTSPDGPGEIQIAADFPTISIEAEPVDLTPVAGWVQPGDADLQYFIATDDNLYSYTNGGGAFNLVGGPVTGFATGVEGIIGAQVDPMTGDIKVATIGCEADANGNYVQSFLYDFDFDTFELSNPVELRDPDATGDEGDTGVCLISFSWDGADEIYGADLVLDDFVSIDATTGLLNERLVDETKTVEDINFIQTAAYDEVSDTHFIFVLSRLDATNANIQGIVYTVNADDEFALAGFIDGNSPPNEVLSGSFPYNNVITTSAEGGPAGAAVAIGAAVPNPAATATRVPFTLEASSDVTLTVFDVLGRKVSTIAEGTYAAGSHDAALDVSTLSPGTYVVRLQAGATVVTRTLSVAR